MRSSLQLVVERLEPIAVEMTTGEVFLTIADVSRLLRRSCPVIAGEAGAVLAAGDGGGVSCATLTDPSGTVRAGREDAYARVAPLVGAMYGKIRTCYSLEATGN